MKFMYPSRVVLALFLAEFILCHALPFSFTDGSKKEHTQLQPGMAQLRETDGRIGPRLTSSGDSAVVSPVLHGFSSEPELSESQIVSTYIGEQLPFSSSLNVAGRIDDLKSKTQVSPSRSPVVMPGTQAKAEPAGHAVSSTTSISQTPQTSKKKPVPSSATPKGIQSAQALGGNDTSFQSTAFSPLETHDSTSFSSGVSPITTSPRNAEPLATSKANRGPSPLLTASVQRTPSQSAASATVSSSASLRPTVSLGYTLPSQSPQRSLTPTLPEIKPSPNDDSFAVALSVSPQLKPHTSGAIQVSPPRAQTSNEDIIGDPEETRGPYQTVSVGQNVSIIVGQQGPFYKGPRGVRMPSLFSDAMLLLQIQRQPLHTRTWTSKHGTASRQTTQQHEEIVTIRSCTVSKEDGESPVSSSRTYLYAFTDDPGLQSTKIIAASGGDLEEQGSCQERARIEVSIKYLESVYLLVSRKKALGIATVNITSRYESRSESFKKTRPWNVLALQQTKRINFNNSKQTGVLKNVYVFILSSPPNLKHEELRNASINPSAMLELAPESQAYPFGPLCDSKGTEVAAALLGQTLGNANTSTIIIPVPIRNCDYGPTQSSLNRALGWVTRHTRSQSLASSFVLIEDSDVLRKVIHQSPIHDEMMAWKKQNVVTILSGDACAKKGIAYLTVAPYGDRAGKIRVAAANDSCLEGFDVLGPGLDVWAASAAGNLSFHMHKASSETAAAGMIGALSNAILKIGHGLKLDDVKQVLRTNMPTIRPTLDNSQVASTGVPIIGIGSSIADLETGIYSLYSNDSDPQESKAAFGTKSSLPFAAIIGICAVAGILVVGLVAGGLFIRFRSGSGNDEDGSDLTLVSERFTAEEAHMAASKSPTGSESLRGQTKTPFDTKNLDLPRGVSQGTPDRAQQVHQTRLPVMQRLLTLTQNKESPPTKSAKASWFATPRGNEKKGMSSFLDRSGSRRKLSMDSDKKNEEGG